MKHTLQLAVNKYNQKAGSSFKIDLKNYGVQYSVYFDSKGRKAIWINGFCDSMRSDPAVKIIEAFDGGSCFFNTNIYLGRKKLSMIAIHGVA